MFYLTTHDHDTSQTITSHHASMRALLDSAKDFIRDRLNDDEVFEELIRAHLAEAHTWKDPDDEMQALVDKFEEQLSGDCPHIVWGKVEVDEEEAATPPPHEIHRLLTVSTGHLPEAMRDRLMDPDSPRPMLATDEYGAWLRTGLGRPEPEVPEEDARTTEEWGPELTVVLAYARQLGCAYVRLDRDGPEYPDLATFN